MPVYDFLGAARAPDDMVGPTLNVQGVVREDRPGTTNDPSFHLLAHKGAGLV